MFKWQMTYPYSDKTHENPLIFKLLIKMYMADDEMKIGIFAMEDS